MNLPPDVASFLACRRIAVVGVSHDTKQPANLIFRKLKANGHEAFAVNPTAQELEGARSYPNLASVPPPVEAVMIVTHPNISSDIVREAAGLGIKQFWFHRSFGDGSVSAGAIEACRAAGITPIVGGCPMMYVEPDFGHVCMRWMLKLSHKVPG